MGGGDLFNVTDANDLHDLARELEGTGYTVVRGLARSAMSEVVIVLRDGRPPEQVLKIVRAARVSDGEADDGGAELGRRLMAEARALRVLVHPNIVRLIDYGLTAAGRPFLVTEKLEGRTLSDEVLLRRRIPPDEAAAIVAEVLQGLDAAHARGLVHRDLKPPNIFYTGLRVGGPRAVKLLDFGIAKAVNAEARDRAGSAFVSTREGFFIGSPSFMAPEQVLSRRVDARADVYAVGAVLYFLLTGQPPFRGARDDILLGHLIQDPAPLRSLAPEVPPALEAIVRRAMEKEPDDRFRTAFAMWQALSDLGLPGALRPARASTGVEALQEPNRREPEDTDRTQVPAHAADAPTAIEPLLPEFHPLEVSAEPPEPTVLDASASAPRDSSAREPIAARGQANGRWSRTEVTLAWIIVALAVLVVVLAWAVLSGAAASGSGSAAPRGWASIRRSGGSVGTSWQTAWTPRGAPTPAGASVSRPLPSPASPSPPSTMTMTEPHQPFGHDTIPQSVLERLRTGSFEVPAPASRLPADTVPVSGGARPALRAARSANGRAPTEPSAAFAGYDDTDPIGAATTPPPADAPRARVPAAYANELDFTPGERFRGLIVGGRFAVGGLSVLYAAKNDSGRDVLLKVLKPAYRGAEPRMRILQDKLVAEGELLLSAEGQNPYLVTVHDVGVDSKVGPFVVMDRLRGKTLDDFIRVQRPRRRRDEDPDAEPPPEPPQPTFKLHVVVELGIAIARGLHTMHLLGAVHRDIKPGNIFIPDATHTRGRYSRIVLLDWGAAKSLYSPNTAFVDHALGTAAYMPPEQLVKGLITGAVDQYALATMLYELLYQHPLADETGRMPDVQGLCNRQLVLPPREPPAYVIPPKLWAIFEKGMAKKASERWSSCDRFAQELEAWKALKETPERPPPALRVPVRPTVPRHRPEPRVREDRPDPVQLLPQAQRIAGSALSEKVTLFVRTGESAGARFEIESRVVLGRHPAHAHVVLDDPGISNAHCALSCIVGEVHTPIWNVVDLESQNGTAVDGIRLDGTFDDATATIKAFDVFLLDDVEIAVFPAGRPKDGGGWQTPAEVRAAEKAAREQAQREQVQREQAAPPPHSPVARTEKMLGANPGASPAPPLASPSAAPAAPPAPAPVAIAPASPRKPTPKPARALAYRHEMALTDHWTQPSLLVMIAGGPGIPGVSRRRFHLDTHGIVGASVDRANIVIDHPEVSGAHCRYAHVTGLHRSDLTYNFEDLGSTNGTTGIVDGAFVERPSFTLHAGNVLFLGSGVCVVLLPPGGFPAPPRDGHIDLRSFQMIEPRALRKHAAGENSPPGLHRRSILHRMSDAFLRSEPSSAFTRLATLALVILVGVAIAFLVLLAKQRGVL